MRERHKNANNEIYDACHVFLASISLWAWEIVWVFGAWGVGECLGMGQRTGDGGRE